MDEIRPWLYIGKYQDTLQIDYLHSKSIQAMLQLAVKLTQPNIASIYLPVEDFNPLNFKLLEQGLSFIKQHKELGHRVLVACWAGINRSSTFCTAALKEEEGLTLIDAFKEVKRRHPESMPNEAVWKSLCNYYEEKAPYMEIMRIHS